MTQPQQPLASFTSHISGRNAKVTIWPDRIEWVRPGRLAVANVLLVLVAVCTCGLSLIPASLRPRFADRDRKMVAIRSIQAVATHRETLHTTVSISVGQQLVEVRVSHGEASRMEELIRQLMLAPPGQVPAR